MIGGTLGHYTITGKLGAGGMGGAYLARDQRLDQDAALRILPAVMAADPQRLQLFEREAKKGECPPPRPCPEPADSPRSSQD